MFALLSLTACHIVSPVRVESRDSLMINYSHSTFLLLPHVLDHLVELLFKAL